MSIVAIKDHQKLVRDTHSKAVLNTDKAGLQEYYAKREVLKKNKKKRWIRKNDLPK
jgi:hypothetical protein